MARRSASSTTAANCGRERASPIAYPQGTVWMRDGWPNLNRLTGGGPVLPDAAVDLFSFSAGQASFDAMVEVAPA